jgi:hypothetical protein
MRIIAGGHRFAYGRGREPGYGAPVPAEGPGNQPVSTQILLPENAFQQAKLISYNRIVRKFTTKSIVPWC